MEILLEKGWRFSLRETAQASAWESVSVPHTWNAVDAQDGGGTNHDSTDGYFRGPGWYERPLEIPEAWKGRRVFVRFQAVGSVAIVHLNDQFVGEHRGTSAAFCFEITKHWKRDGPNTLRVKADNTYRLDVPPLAGDFPVYGGIYRPVSLIAKPITCITPLDYASSGVYVSQQSVSKEKAEVEVLTKIDHAGNLAEEVSVEVSVLDADREVVKALSPRISITAGGQGECRQHLTLDHPRLWQGRKDPHLYTVQVRLLSSRGELDRVCQPLGLRFYAMDPQRGFLLNGEPYPLYGVCCHEERPGQGWAVSLEDLKEDHDLMYEMGARAVRLAHYPHSEAFHSLCDQSGLLLWAEVPIVDKVSRHPEFLPNARQQVIEMIRQRYNHPSVFTWGLSNELRTSSNGGEAVLKDIHALAKKEDPYRPTVLALAAGFPPEFCRISDLVGFNCYPGWYGGRSDGLVERMKNAMQASGQRGICVSEYGAGASVKHHEQNPKQPQPVSQWHPEEWQSRHHEIQWAQIQDTPYCWGSFVWVMFDFASSWRHEGDTVGINDKGMVTQDRQVRKDAFFFYKANWTEDPVLHLTSSRHTLRKEAITPVKVYSNAPEVSLTVNGKALGTVKPDSLHIAIWKAVELSPGKNLIEVSATHNNKLLSHKAEWVLEPTIGN